jgi:two-component system nitrogen regulation sensor histidine kinase GlnL
LPDVRIDRHQVIQALLNIVRNAAEALGTSGEISLRTRCQRNLTLGPRLHKLVIRVDVIDNGPGISDDIKDSLFYPMVTGRPEGTGLGLSISQNLIHKQGGLIEFESRPGDTVFTVWLPVEEIS